MSELEKNPWTVQHQQTVYETPWIRVDHHDVSNAAGYPGVYGTVHFKNYAIGILALDEEMNTWLVGQYRFPLQTYTWEIPEGGGPVGEDPLESAQRELLEEVGVIAKNWKLIQQLQLSNSATDEVAFLYLATGLSFQQAQPDEGEVLQLKKIPFEELYHLVKRGEITDSLRVAAVLRVKLMQQEGEL